MIAARFCAPAPVDNPLLLRLRGLSTISPDEEALLRRVTAQARHYASQTVLCAAGEVQAPRMLLSGWACHQRVLGDGRRQIIGFVLPGDLTASITRPTMPMPHVTLALTPVVVGDATALRTAVEAGDAERPGLAMAMQRMAHAEDVRLRDQIVRLGRQTAYERVVHLMLEFRDRLASVGLAHDDSFTLPVTQEVLADALGLSVVHINRTLQQLRRDKLFETRGGQVLLRQIELMQATADWPPPRIVGAGRRLTG